MENEKYDRILCFGEVLWDMLPAGKMPGGAPLNVAIHLKKQGKIPVLVSAVGNDEEGESLIRYLQQSEVYSYLIQRDDWLPTSKVVVHLDDGGNATYEICDPVAWDNIRFNAEVVQAAESADLLVYGTLASRNPLTRNTLLQLLEKTSAKRLLDVNLRPPYKREVVAGLLAEADFVKLNDEELKAIAAWDSVSGNEREQVLFLSEKYNCKMVCVTRGAKGALLYSGNAFFEHPGFTVKVVDTVGAGDSFLAALVVALSKGMSEAGALERACAVGALVASREGAVPHYTEAEILDMIKSS